MEHLQTLHRPVLSTDNIYLAFITQFQELNILNLKSTRLIHLENTPRSVRSFLPEASILRWAPETIIASDGDMEGEVSRTWLLLAGGSKLVVVELDLPHHHHPMTTDSQGKVRVLADYQFEPHYGKIVIANFVFNHNQALIMFEMNVHASLISFDKLQRRDIPRPKFASSQGFVQSENQDRFALLLRSGSQDQVMVFASATDDAEQSTTFPPDTIDAQSLAWSPDHSPILAVWDSAAYGPRISFYTALGHPLRHVDLTSESLARLIPSQEIPGVGVTCLNWSINLVGGMALVAGIGESKLVFCHQDQRSMETQTVILQHRNEVDGSQCAIWQQTAGNSFDFHSIILKIPVEPHSEINYIATNARANCVATKIDTAPNIAWLWEIKNQKLSGLIIFENEIKQILWHPSLNNVLAIVTNEKNPFVYTIHDLQQPPNQVPIPLKEVLPTSRWEARWVQTADAKRCPLLVSSTKQLDLGFLGRAHSHAVYESTLVHDDFSRMLDEEETSILDTPSKSGTIPHKTNDRALDTTGYLWNANASLEKW